MNKIKGWLKWARVRAMKAHRWAKLVLRWTLIALCVILNAVGMVFIVIAWVGGETASKLKVDGKTIED